MRNGLLEHRHTLRVRSGAMLLRPEADSTQLTGVYQRGFPGEEPYLTFALRNHLGGLARPLGRRFAEKATDAVAAGWRWWSIPYNAFVLR